MRRKKRVLIYAENEWVAGDRVLPLRVRIPAAVEMVFTRQQAAAAMASCQQDIVVVWRSRKRGFGLAVYRMAKARNLPVLLVSMASGDCRSCDRFLIGPRTVDLLECMQTLMIRKRGAKHLQPVFPEISRAPALTCERDAPTV